MTTRENLHALIDQLADDDLDAAEATLRRLKREPGLRDIPEDDEPYTEAGVARWIEILSRHRTGAGVPTEEVVKRFDRATAS